MLTQPTTQPATRHTWHLPHRAALIGTYQYLCLIAGTVVYSHHPVGKVLWHRPADPS